MPITPHIFPKTKVDRQHNEATTTDVTKIGSCLWHLSKAAHAELY